MIDAKNIRIETDRLILRKWEKSDLEDFFMYAKEEGVGELAGWPHHKSISTSEIILNDFILKNNVLAIVLKENNRVIGSFGMHNSWAMNKEEYKNLKIVDIGYVLSKEYWGKGIMPEATRAFIDYAFNTLLFDGISCAHFSENTQSKRVIEKTGFTYIEDGEVHSKLLNKTFKDKRYILLKKNYLA